MSFQIDKVTGDNERIEFGASAGLGPVGVGARFTGVTQTTKQAFTGVALSTGAAGVNLTVGLGSEQRRQTVWIQTQASYM